MVDGRGAPVRHTGDELRRIIAEPFKRRRRMAIAVLAGSAILSVAASLLWKVPVLLVWNVSASAPIGLYRVHVGAPVDRGDIVIAWMPEPARSLAARRHYVPANVPLVKRVAALAGDRVCAASAAVSVNGRRVAVRRRSDRAGRPMPWWSGCRRLRANEYFLLMDSRLSFDGRYFGLTRRDDLLGRAELLWERPAKGVSDG